jgi:hypothetical protein
MPRRAASIAAAVGSILTRSPPRPVSTFASCCATAEDSVPGGWIVTGDLQGWQFRFNDIPAGLRISASAPGGGDPAVWVVTR